MSASETPYSRVNVVVNAEGTVKGFIGAGYQSAIVAAMIRGRDELGAHMSIAGGLHLALERGRAVGCGAVQIFLKNQRQWAAKPLAADEVRAFRAARRATAIRHVFAHSSYLINLGNPNISLWSQAVAAFTDELERAESLGLSCVVIRSEEHTSELQSRSDLVCRL